CSDPGHPHSRFQYCGGPMMRRSRLFIPWPVGRILASLVLVLSALSISELFPPGSATTIHAAPVSYTAVLTGPGESPPNTSPGTGFTQVDIDLTAHTLRVQVSFSGLVAGT